VTSARTSQYELQEDEIKGALSNASETFNLDRLDDDETASLIGLLDRYAFWGQRQSQSSERKAHFVKVDCSGELRSVILDLLDSPNIKSRIQEILKFDDGEVEGRIRSVLVISQLLNLAQTCPRILPPPRSARRAASARSPQYGARCEA
jgi:hypothetical protein